MVQLVYILGALVSLACGLLLMRAYFKVRKRLLLWSGLCFLGLALQNFLVFLDLIMLPNVDLYSWRLLLSAVSVLTLLFGLIWNGAE